MHFRFKDKEKPRGYTSALSGILHVSQLYITLLSSYYILYLIKRFHMFVSSVYFKFTCIIKSTLIALD